MTANFDEPFTQRLLCIVPLVFLGGGNLLKGKKKCIGGLDKEVNIHSCGVFGIFTGQRHRTCAVLGSTFNMKSYGLDHCKSTRLKTCPWCFS